MRLLGDRAVSWQNRAHFFVAASKTMRRILIDHARKHRASKRAGDRRRVDLDGVAIAIEEQADDLVALDTALEKLAELDPRLVRVVELRFFTGMNVEETAKTLGMSDTTVKRDWALARAFLEKEIRG
jgi:RNA polymerase sigma factor (TIGR02999 family)